jgi:hypothetical protein
MRLRPCATGGRRTQRQLGSGWLSTLAVASALVAGLAVAAPSDAAASSPWHSVTKSLGESAKTLRSHNTSSLTPLNQAIVSVTNDSSGATNLYKFNNVSPCETSPADHICLNWGNGLSQGSGIAFSAINGVGVYQASNFANGSTVGVNGQICPFDWIVEVDQWQYSGTAIQAAAVQFDCTSGTYDVSGTVAYNVVPTDPGDGYYVFGQQGEITGFGNDNYLSYVDGAQNYNLNAPIVAMAPTPDGGGYWMVGSDGGVYASGDAGFFGSTGSIHLNKPVVGMTATPDGKGYWFVATDGGIFAYGDAGFYGSMGGKPLNKPIVGMASTPSGHGYWLVASDGGIFAYGDAGFFGSTGSIHLNKPVVGMVPTPSGRGYWFVASDGGIFSYGNAGFFGSTGSIQLAAPIVGMTAAPDGGGYWFVASDGGVFNYGSAQFFGSLGGTGVTDAAGLSLGI